MRGAAYSPKSLVANRSPQVLISFLVQRATSVHRLWYNSLCTFLRFYPGKPLIQGQSETGGCNLASARLAFFQVFWGLEQLWIGTHPHTFLVFLEIRQKDQKHKNFRVEIIWEFWYFLIEGESVYLGNNLTAVVLDRETHLLLWE